MTSKTLSDVAAHTRAAQAIALHAVGMQGILVPLHLLGQPLSMWATARVRLDDPQARGIHMSRLYLALEALVQQRLTPLALKAVLQQFLASHQGLSSRAYLELSGTFPVRRPALVSPLSGWKGYPIRITGQLDEAGLQLWLRLDLTYSSTCPCSASLTREWLQQHFAQQFSGPEVSREAVLAWLGSEAGSSATPHSQRSVACLELYLKPDCTVFPLFPLLETAEAALGTAVQTAVKRVDEQAFAQANGQNLMFCEDAARRLHQSLLSLAEAQGFRIAVSHLESLHAHDAIAESRHNWVGPD